MGEQFNGVVNSHIVAQIKVEYHKNASTSSSKAILLEEGRTLIAVYADERTTLQSPGYKP